MIRLRIQKMKPEVVPMMRRKMKIQPDTVPDLLLHTVPGLLLHIVPDLLLHILLPLLLIQPVVFPVPWDLICRTTQTPPD